MVVGGVTRPWGWLVERVIALVFDKVVTCEVMVEWREDGELPFNDPMAVFFDDFLILPACSHDGFLAGVFVERT